MVGPLKELNTLVFFMSTTYQQRMLTLMLKKTLSVGNFNESFDKTHEDVELGLRLTRKGHQLLYVPNNTVWNDSANSYMGWVKRLFRFAHRRILFNKLTKSRLNSSTLYSVALVVLLIITLTTLLIDKSNFITTTLQFACLFYLFLVLIEGLRSSLRYKMSAISLLFAPLAALNILVIHLTYGLGSIFGSLKNV